MVRVLTFGVSTVAKENIFGRRVSALKLTLE